MLKLVLLMYLEDDEPVVTRMLTELEITSFSRLHLEGHGDGAPGWYGEIAPFRSRLSFVVLPTGRVHEVLAAVRNLGGIEADPAHPVHAVVVNIEESADSGPKIPT